MTDTASPRREHPTRARAALRVAVALVAAVTVMVVGLAGLFASSASARTLAGPETGVGVFGAAGGQVVGADEPVLAGQRRARAPDYDRMAVGSCVAAETAPAGVSMGPGAAHIDDPALLGGGPQSPDFVVHPNGDVVPVPQGAVGPSPVESGNGFQYEGGSGGNGLDPRTSNVRIMDPVTSGKYPYPNGYVSYSNASGQAVDPYTGQTVARSSPWWHWPF